MNGKKPMMILIVVLIVVLLGYILPIVFSFEPNIHDKKNYQQIDDQYINVLYSYLPSDNYSNSYNNYNEYYTQKSNLSKTIMMGMVYNYIVNSDRFKLIVIDEEENDDALYKIRLEDYKKAYHTVFYEDDFQGVDFEYNNIKGIVKNNYVYIYNNNGNEKYVNYKEIDSYALAKDGDEIIIYEYYTKCDKASNVCYNDANTTNTNSKVSNLNFDNSENLAKYKHVFKFDTDSYYWYSSEIVK